LTPKSVPSDARSKCRDAREASSSSMSLCVLALVCSTNST
jgi:hypothetical protein